MIHRPSSSRCRQQRKRHFMRFTLTGQVKVYLLHILRNKDCLFYHDISQQSCEISNERDSLSKTPTSVNTRLISKKAANYLVTYELFHNTRNFLAPLLWTRRSSSTPCSAHVVVRSYRSKTRGHLK